MLTYDRLAEKPRAFRAVTGMTRNEFESLFADHSEAASARRAARTRTKRNDEPLRRALGAGRPFALDGRTRLLMTLFWLRVYPTYQLLGLLFGLDESNAWRNVQDVKAVLESMADFPFDPPGKGRKRPGTMDELFAAHPDLCVIVDSKEQAIRRPAGWEAQKPFYSGKKKRHTVKTQVACSRSGRIAAVSVSVPGRGADITLLRKDGLTDRMPKDIRLLGDKAYKGAVKDAAPSGRIVDVPKPKRKKQPLTDEEKTRNKRLNRERVVVEHVMAQLNRFEVLRQTFRSRFARHSGVIRTVAMIVDRRIARKPLNRMHAAA